MGTSKPCDMKSDLNDSHTESRIVWEAGAGGLSHE